MAKFTVDSDQLQSAVGAVRSEIDAVQTHSNQLTTQLNNLEVSWQGQASAAFQSVVEQWRATQKQVEDAINNINTALSSAANYYGTTEQDVIRMFS